MKDFYPGKRQIHPVLEREKARLGLSIVDDEKEEKIAFDILDPRLMAYGLMRMPHMVNNDPREIIPVLHGAAHFYLHLNRKAKDALVDTYIKIECKTLVPTNEIHHNSKEAILKPTGNNHIHSNVIDIVSSNQTMYGFRITNKSGRDLYLNLFYFNNNDFSIGKHCVV